MSNASPQKPPARTPGVPRGLVCPSCQGGSFSQRSSFKTASEPLLGAESTAVVVDLMICSRCGAEFPTVKGRRRFSLVGVERLTALIAELEEAKRVNAEMQGVVEGKARLSQGLEADIETSMAEQEVSIMEARVAALESETSGLEARRERLARTVELISSRMHK